MGRAIDIERRRRPQVETPLLPPARRQRGSPGLFWLLILAAGSLLFFNQLRLAPNQTNVSSSSSSTSITQTPSYQSLTPSSILVSTSSPSSSLPAEQGGSSPAPSSQPTSPSPLPAEEAGSATPPTINKATLSIRILNGSGTAGQANTLKKHLQSEGFTIRSIAVAKTRRADTIIYYQKDQRAVADFVAGFIPDRLIVFEENDTLAKPDDILIIVGAK